MEVGGLAWVIWRLCYRRTGKITFKEVTMRLSTAIPLYFTIITVGLAVGLGLGMMLEHIARSMI